VVQKSKLLILSEYVIKTEKITNTTATEKMKHCQIFSRKCFTWQLACV